MRDIADQLRSALGDVTAVLTGEDVHERSAGIWGPPRNIVADTLVRPSDTDGVAKILSICSELGQPVVTQGGLTGVVESAWASPGEVVLSMERFNRIEEVDVVGRTMTVEAGVPLQVVQEAAENHGLMFPLDLGARGSASIGGNAATNAGGNRVIRYGMARALVLGLEVVLADGTVLNSMNRMLKNNAGYDLKQLFIGSEGTLGVITRLVLRLMPQQRSQNTALVAVREFDIVAKLLGFVDTQLGGHLSAFEVMWQDAYRLLTTPPAVSKPPLDHDYEYYILIEAMGSDQTRDSERFEEVLADAFGARLIVDAVIAKSKAEVETMWAVRDDVVVLNTLKPMFLFDVSLAIRDMENYVEEVENRVNEAYPGNQLIVFGHLGDCNLHVAVSAGSEDGSARENVEEIVYAPLRSIGGSVSAEHGIGLEKKPYLSWCRDDAEITLMRSLKATLDPKGILNPGKIFELH